MKENEKLIEGLEEFVNNKGTCSETVMLCETLLKKLEPKPKKKLFLANTGNYDLAICYGRQGDYKALWIISNTSGKILINPSSLNNWHELHSEWVANGCLFDDSSIDWTGKSNKGIYYLSLCHRKVLLIKQGCSAILNCIDRSSISCIDANILCDEKGIPYIL